jgi:ribulose-bisphosphate carboxylase small chain
MSTAEMKDYRSLLHDPESRRFETFSYLTEMDAAAIRKQIQTMLDKGWDVAIEHVEPERSHRTYWYMWKLPLFGQGKIDTIMTELNACRNAYPGHHIKVIGYDHTRQTQGMAMVVYRVAG